MSHGDEAEEIPKGFTFELKSKMSFLGFEIENSPPWGAGICDLILNFNFMFEKRNS